MDLPPYSQSVPAPTYSSEPAGDEQVLQHTPRRPSRPLPTGTFIKKSGKTTLLLTDQDSDASVPSYGRHGTISGAILLEDSEMITEVEFEIEGKLDATISDGGGKTTDLFKQKYTLWSRPKASSSTSIESCPEQLPLNFILPSTFRDSDSDKPLPPSFTGFFQGSPTLFVKSSYLMRIRITRVVSSKVDFWTKKKHILVPFMYVPRTRPYRPILPSPGFFSSIKTSPEEWFQATSNIKTRPRSSLEPLPIHVFVPAGRVYCVTDAIPFHLQITGSVSSLRELFSSPSNSLNRILSSDSQTTVSSASTHSPQPESKPIIRVSIVRQVTVEVRGEKAWRNTTIAEGTLSSVPPMMSSCWSAPQSDCSEEHLDWEGTLKCGDSVVASAFAVSSVQVKEIILVNIAPLNPSKSPLLELQVAIPIRLVSEPWGDAAALDTSSFAV